MKKVLLTILSVLLVAGISVAGTIAFLQDTDGDVNVMTVGSVRIKQIEYERKDTAGTGDAELREFTQQQPIDPSVIQTDSFRWDTPSADLKVGDYNAKIWSPDEVINVRDKIVLVENTGLSQAYVRTWFAFEQGSIRDLTEFSEYVAMNINTTDWTWSEMIPNVTIDGTKYVLLCATYRSVLSMNEVTEPSLLQYAMTTKANNKLMDSFDGSYDILVVSQAVQTIGFGSATEALDRAFGTYEAANQPFDRLLDEETTAVGGETTTP